MPSAVPGVWRDPSNHSSDCYSCLTPPVASGMNRKKQRIDYPNIPFAIRPVPHGEDLSVPEPPKDYTLNSEMEEGDTEKTDLQIQTSKVHHLSHLTHLHKTN